MLAFNRHKEILSLLDEQGSVRTIDLAAKLNVTDETIRRDLEKLEKDNLVQRTHGGAVKSQHLIRDRSFEERNIQNITEKKRIAKAAAQIIQKGDRIFIDASSTALQLMPYIENMEITVITNSTNILKELEGNESIEVILAGGTLDRQTRSFIGPATMATLRRYRINTAFISGNGIDLIRGVSESNEAQAYIKEMILPRSSNVVFMSDPSKLGAASNYFFARCDEINTLVTCAEADHPILKDLSEEGTQIIRAE